MATRPVVAGVDGSEQSLQAVEWAAMEAKRHGLPLRIVSAPALLPRVHSYHESPAAVSNALRGISARALAAALTRSEEVAPGLYLSTELLSGSPAMAVAECGAEAAMLVVGARGAGGFTAMVLGSVSRYVASRAECPVVVVREEAMAVHREIAVGVRDPQGTTEALAFAFEEAAMRHADLVAVHAWSRLPSSVSLRAETETAAAESRLTAALDRWRDKYPDVRVRQDVIHGHPARVLASYSARADLVVIGRHRHPDGGGPGIGSIQHAVLDHAHGPVAVVPAGGGGSAQPS